MRQKRQSNNAGSVPTHGVHVKCSRCKKVVEGTRTPEFTGGFYDVTAGYWHMFSRPGEKRLCDQCMWDSPEYQIVHGVQHGAPDVRETPRGRLIAYKLKQIAAMQGAVREPHLEPLCIIGPKIPTMCRIGGK